MHNVPHPGSNGFGLHAEAFEIKTGDDAQTSS